MVNIIDNLVKSDGLILESLQLMNYKLNILYSMNFVNFVFILVVFFYFKNKLE